MKAMKCHECFFLFTQEKKTIDDIKDCLKAHGNDCIIATFCQVDIKEKVKEYVPEYVEDASQKIEPEKEKGQYKPPVEYDVNDIRYFMHVSKTNNSLSMQVSYDIECPNNDNDSVSEWVCVEHEGYARKKAVEWLKDHLPAGYPMPDTIEEALELKDEYRKPVKIFVDYNQKFPRIISRLYE
jgi:hypothetical protein